MAATRSSTDRVRSTAVRAAPGPRRGWRISTQRGGPRLGDAFVHESYIGSRFIGRIEEKTWICDRAAIVPSIEGSAITTGFNQIWIDDEDQFARGFQVT